MTLNTGDVVRAVVRQTAVFGLFCECGTHEILVLVPETSWIPSFASCEQVAAVGDGLVVKIIHIDRQRNKAAGSLIALHPESDPWHGAWQLGVGDVLEATVVWWVERADRCGGAGGYLLALRPAALVMLCGQESGRFKSGDRCAVRVTSLDPTRKKVTVAWVHPAVAGTPGKHAFFLPPLLRSHREFVFDPVSFLWHVPIFDEERAYKQEHGADALNDRMGAVELPWVFDENNRPSLVE